MESCNPAPRSKNFFFSKSLPNSLIYFDGLDYYAIALTGNKQYGWDKRTKVYLHPNNLIKMSINEARLVADACGMPHL